MRGARRRAPSAWLGGLLLAVGVQAGADELRPNVLLVTIDTLRRDHTSLHGHSNPTTPGLERLGAEGVVFETAYAPSSTTAPSHASIFTGLYPPAHGVQKNAVPLPRRHETLAERLAAEGYQTAAVVSSFVLDSKFQWDQGFEVYLDDFAEADRSVKPERWEGHAIHAGFDRRALATTRLASRWLWERDRGRPFFLFVHYFDPHSPYAPPEAFPQRFPTPPASATTPGPRIVREQRALYDAEIAYTDRALAELLEVLRREGLDESTVVAVTGDHGEGLLDHGFMSHGTTLYEEVTRVPLVVRWKGELPPRRLEDPVGLVDLAPTLLELVGAPDARRRGFRGHSLAAALRGKAPLDAGREIFLARRPYEAAQVEGRRVDGRLYGIRVGPWKYLEGDDASGAELYHLERDPGERRNLRDRHPEQAARLAARLAAWKTAEGEGAPLPEIDEADVRALEALGYVE